MKKAINFFWKIRNYVHGQAYHRKLLKYEESLPEFNKYRITYSETPDYKSIYFYIWIIFAILAHSSIKFIELFEDVHKYHFAPKIDSYLDGMWMDGRTKLERMSQAWIDLAQKGDLK